MVVIVAIIMIMVCELSPVIGFTRKNSHLDVHGSGMLFVLAIIMCSKFLAFFAQVVVVYGTRTEVEGLVRALSSLRWISWLTSFMIILNVSKCLLDFMAVLGEGKHWLTFWIHSKQAVWRGYLLEKCKWAIEGRIWPVWNDIVYFFFASSPEIFTRYPLRLELKV